MSSGAPNRTRSALHPMNNDEREKVFDFDRNPSPTGGERQQATRVDDSNIL